MLWDSGDETGILRYGVYSCLRKGPEVPDHRGCKWPTSIQCTTLEASQNGPQQSHIDLASEDFVTDLPIKV